MTLGTMFSSEDRKADLLKTICENCSVRAPLKQYLSDICSTRNELHRTFPQDTGYNTLLIRFGGVGGDTCGQRRGEITNLRKCLLQNIVEKDELDMSWWHTCSDITLLQTDSDDRVETVGSSLKGGNYWRSKQVFQDVVNSSGECRGKTLPFFRNSMYICVLLKFLGFNPYVDEGEVMSWWMSRLFV